MIKQIQISCIHLLKDISGFVISRSGPAATVQPVQQVLYHIFVILGGVPTSTSRRRAKECVTPPSSAGACSGA